MIYRLRSFLRQDHGQGLSEYCLLAALFALVGFGVFCMISGRTGDLWTVTNHTMHGQAGTSAGARTSH